MSTQSNDISFESFDCHCQDCEAARADEDDMDFDDDDDDEEDDLSASQQELIVAQARESMRAFAEALKARAGQVVKQEAEQEVAPMAKKQTVDVVKVVRTGEQLIIPESLPLDRAITVLQRQLQYDEEMTAVHSVIEGFPWEGAYALTKVLETRFGLVFTGAITQQGMFGPRKIPPMLKNVKISLTESVDIPLGALTVPGVDGELQTGFEPNDQGVVQFTIRGEVKRKHEALVNSIIEDVRKRVREQPIYKGKAFTLRLRDDDFDPLSMPEPSFLELRPETVSELTFSQRVMDDIGINIFAFIQHRDAALASGVPKKRGVLLSGKFGTGKSMTVHATAVIATDNGWTFIQAESPLELAEVVRIADMYRPAVVFCEDIDRVTEGGRDMRLDHLLNVIDGIESKTHELMVVLTTNAIENIDQAMLRPGRLDAVINVEPPDAAAAERLMRLYGRGLIADTEDISEAAALMAGHIPAAIQGVVERSKLAALWRGEDNTITVRALVASAESMLPQLALLAPREAEDKHPYVKAARVMAEAIRGNGGHAAVMPVPPSYGMTIWPDRALTSPAWMETAENPDYVDREKN